MQECVHHIILLSTRGPITLICLSQILINSLLGQGRSLIHVKGLILFTCEVETELVPFEFGVLSQSQIDDPRLLLTVLVTNPIDKALIHKLNYHEANQTDWCSSFILLVVVNHVQARLIDSRKLEV